MQKKPYVSNANFLIAFTFSLSASVGFGVDDMFGFGGEIGEFGAVLLEDTF